ncbi:MAG: FAD-dependent protein [Bacteroidota bacterium]
MPETVTLRLSPRQVGNAELIEQLVAKQLRVAANRIHAHQLIRRSIDSRGKSPKFQLRYQVWVDGPPQQKSAFQFPLQSVENARPIHIVGFGPAGMWAAMHAIRLGYKPVVIERGKAVRPRRRDLAKLTREGLVDPDSNYCFGEGGAGTFSDGKLYTRSGKRGDVRQVLEMLHEFGATEDILIDAHPHIGTNKLPAIIQRIREAIIECGGEVHFETKVTGFEVKAGKLVAVEINGQDKWSVEALVLATGHSARDIFRLLHQAEIPIEAKPFALGVRVEHPQEVIDRIQYHCVGARHDALPAASYSLVHQVRQKGVYSFCMCPGGIICPAATQEGEVVVNGWSPSKRNSPYANSGMVVELALTDWNRKWKGPLGGMEFQSRIEQRAFQAGGGKQQAPAARLTDFVNGKISQNLPNSSYLPGLTASDLGGVLPRFIHQRLQHGFQQFGRKMKGYLTEEAVVVGVESRTSSPVRIPRDRDTLMHPNVSGLFPCGEGAGYAGGIVSAAMDGSACVEAAVAVLTER